MKKKSLRFLCLICTAALIGLLAAVLVGCDTSDGYKAADYYISVSISDDMKTVDCVTDIDFRYTGDSADKVRLLMNSAAFSEKLLAEPHNIKEAYPKGESYGKVQVHAASIDGNIVEARIVGNVLELSGQVKNGKSYKIHTEYTLTMPFTKLRYGYNDYSLNLAHFYPQYAPIYEYDLNGDPFNNFADNYRVKIEYPSKFETLASGDLISESEQDGRKTDEYESEKCRDFSIVTARDYNRLSADADGVKVNYIYSTDKTPESSLSAAVDAIKVFSKLFGKYNRKTLQVAETAFLYGGMEYSGLVTVANDCQALDREKVIIHETAHQWWYDAVHSDQVLHAWQDEGLTEYSVILFYEETGRQDISKKIIWDAKTNVDLYRQAIARDGAAVDERIDRAAYDFGNGSEYTFSTYVKGQLMFNYISETLGKEKFLSALKDYYKANNGRNMTEPQELIDAFDNKLEGIGIVIRAWLDGKLYSL